MADMLATPEDLAALLQQDLDRATAELLIEAATAVVQNAAGGQRILRVVDDTITMYLDEVDDPLWVYLPQRPVISVVSVVVGASPVSDWSPQFNRGRIYRANGWAAGSSIQTDGSAPGLVTVTYTHGYADGDQRLQLARTAVLMLAAGGYTNPTSATREQIDDYAVQYAEAAARMEVSGTVAAALRKQYGRTRTSVRLVRS